MLKLCAAWATPPLVLCRSWLLWKALLICMSHPACITLVTKDCRLTLKSARPFALRLLEKDSPIWEACSWVLPRSQVMSLKSIPLSKLPEGVVDPYLCGSKSLSWRCWNPVLGGSITELPRCQHYRSLWLISQRPGESQEHQQGSLVCCWEKNTGFSCQCDWEPGGVTGMAKREQRNWRIPLLAHICACTHLHSVLQLGVCQLAWTSDPFPISLNYADPGRG